jgi:hypothetical protein
MMPEEKRRFNRIYFDVPVAIKVAGRTYAVREVANLSVGGCLLEIKDALPCGADCTVAIFVDGKAQGLRIDIKGEIARNDTLGVAIKFKRMSADSLAHLKNVVKYSLPFLTLNPESRGRAK